MTNPYEQAKTSMVERPQGITLSFPAYQRLQKIVTIAEEVVNPGRFKNGVSEAQAWELVARLVALGIHLRAEQQTDHRTAVERALVVGDPLP